MNAFRCNTTAGVLSSFLMKFIVSHPTGNRNVRAVIEGLSNHQLLAGFYTTIITKPGAPWLSFLPQKFKDEFLRRTYNVPASLVHGHPLLEVARMVLSKLTIVSAVAHETGWASVDSVYANLDKKVAGVLLKGVPQATHVYAYEDGALQTFEAAKKQGVTCVYDLPIAYWEVSRTLLVEEGERLAAWAPTLGGGTADSNEKLQRKSRELELADIVVTPGSFVRDSIPAWANQKKIVMSPFGSPNSTAANMPDKKAMAKRPLRVLFAGSMSQRKGLGDLFEAIKLLNNNNIQLVVMGSLMAPMEFYKGQLSQFTYETGRPNSEVLALMRSCDVFCLPSIVEGRALVMQEAMSQGLPIIITANTGGADLVIEGETGFIVPIRSPQSIAEKIDWCEQNREAVGEMGNKARLHAQKYTWDNYVNLIIDTIIENVNLPRQHAAV